MPLSSHPKVNAAGSGRSRRWRPALVALVLLVAAGCVEGTRPWTGDGGAEGDGGARVSPGTGPRTVLQARSGGTFIFSAAGDYGTSSEAATTLESIGRGEAAFHLALGDLSYGSIKPETAWCEFVRSRVGPDLPFQLLAGNHDSDGEPEGGHIDAFRTCLPNRMDGVVGRYARQYYFDYPRARPLARFILVAPGYLIGGVRFSYRRGDPGYRWVADAVDGARAVGVRWVVVGSHAPCLSVGNYDCEMGDDLFDLLVDRKVDLILSGHDHSYQRSVQVAHTRTCPVVPPGEYDGSCVADDAADGRYAAGAGTVQVVAGTGGQGLYDVDLAQPDGAYMAAVMGANAEPSHGLVEVVVGPRALSGRFVATTGTFHDSFAIVAGGQAAAVP